MARGQNIFSRVFNKPQLITLESFQPIVDYLADPQRASALKLSKPVEQEKLLRSDFDSEEAYNNRRLKRMGINPETMVGYLEIKDTLVNRSGQLNADCMELTSYEGLKQTFKAQVAEGIKHCVLMVDSGGGEAYGCFEAANSVQKLAKENGVKLTAYVDGMAASAAFAWTVIADEVIANPMAQVGSVGVVVQLYNNSRMLKDMGIDRSFVYAGGNKIPFDANGEFTEKFISDLQDSVNKSYSKFVSHVATHMNLSEDAVKDTQASVYDADVALQKGFVHKLMEIDEFEDYISPKATSTNTVYFNNTADASASLEHNKETLTMTEQVIETPVEQALDTIVETVEQALDVTTEGQEQVLTVEGLQAQLSDLQANFDAEKQTLTAQLADFQAKLGTANEQLAQAQKALSDYKEEVQQKARLAQLEAVFGKDSEKPKEYATIFASLDDVAFGKVLQGFATSVEQLEASLEEVGSAAPVEAVTQTAEDITLEVARKKKAARTQ